MSAPIPRPSRARINLKKMMAGQTDAIALQAALETIFPKVVAEMNDHPFYQFRIRCADMAGRVRLLVCFGWAVQRDGWSYLPIAGE